jgi:hypothetical protein
MNSDGSFRFTWSVGVDKHWPSMNAYKGLGFNILLCDFHGIKAFDKQLYERTGLTKEACCQLGIILRLLKRGRGPDFAQGMWLPALVELLLGWVRDGHFGVDMELVRAVLAYVQAMWLKPIILAAWSDTSALAQPGYETTNSMLEGAWRHMDRIVFGGLWNTSEFKARAPREARLVRRGGQWPRYCGRSKAAVAFIGLGRYAWGGTNERGHHARPDHPTDVRLRARCLHERRPGGVSVQLGRAVLRV